MQSYTLTLFGMEVSFKTDAEEMRVEEARELLESRFNGLQKNAGDMSKEKLLTFLALSLADDYLVAEATRSALEEKIEAILEKEPGI